MGIATGTFQQLLQEHRLRPFKGALLTLGRQDIYLSADDVRYWTGYYGVPCADLKAPDLTLAPNAPASRFVSDRALFAFLGVSCESLDASRYEGCDHVADLNTPEPPSALHERYDIVLDAGTLEHVFHLPNAFQFCHGLLKQGGRMIHMSPLSNYADHGFYQMSPTLFHDYYEANGWGILQMRVIRHTPNHDTDPYWATDYSSRHFAQLSFGGLGDGLYQSFVVVEKRPGATATVIPQQRTYRHAWSGTRPDGVLTGAVTSDRIAGDIRTLLRDRESLLKAIQQAAGENLRIAVFGGGRHTSILLRVWRELNLPEPAVVFATRPPETAECDGLPMISLADMQLRAAPNLIVLSSKVYEGEMAATCAEKLPSVPVLRLWT